MEVKRIPVDVQCLLSASARITTYKRAVEELVYNSLDAKSTCIAIRLNIQKNWIQVVDNGIGIKKSDYKLLGERYATSKLLDIKTFKAIPSKYGYQGQALANIIEVSQTVKITSRCSDSIDTWVKTFLEGQIEREKFKTLMRPSKGTTVEINGFLYNSKIQKKCINAFNELQEIKTFLEQLLLVFNNVSISLRDDARNEVIFKMHKNRDIYQTLKSLFDIEMNSVQELQVEKNEYKVKAFVGIDKVNIQKFYWIYLNNKFINVSNLHDVITKKFTKSSCMKHRQIKTLEAFDKENTVVFPSVTFYILFITCPYYEYDIITSGKQTSVQFKNWMQMNTLIEKLVRFYNSDINLININKKDNQYHEPKNTEGTRSEVKKIIEKILGRPNKISRVSQMKNGVKGKQVKRKRKKLPVKISLTKRTSPKKSSCKYLDNKEKIKSQTIVEKAITPNYNNSNIHPKLTVKHSKSKYNLSRKSHKISKKTLKCKCNKKYKNLIEIFKNDAHLIKRKCDKLSHNIKDNLNNQNCENIKNTSINQLGNKTPTIKRKEYITNKPKNYINKSCIDNGEFQYINNNEKVITKIIRSYDLLQPVINTQQGFYDQESSKEDAHITLDRSNIQRLFYEKSDCYAPKLTFQSHKFNINSKLIEKTVPRKVQVISKQLRDNVNKVGNKHEGNIQITDKITKRHDSFDTKNRRKQRTEKFNILFRKYAQDGLKSPFVTNISDADIVELSKRIRNQVMNDMNTVYNNSDCNNNFSPRSQINFGVNLNIEKTYTILMDSFSNFSQGFNKNKNRETFVDNRVNYKNVSSHDVIRSEFSYKTSDVIFSSELQDIVDEPLDIALLNNSKDIENNYNIGNNVVQNSSLIIEESAKSNELLNTNSSKKHDDTNYKSQINTSKNKTDISENDAEVVSITENEEYNGNLAENNKIGYRNDSDEAQKILNNSVYNFKLNTRHRFMPKGMSQIFKTCFSKNICSYNFDTEYFENTIYNNFVEDVVVNSEIFEPNIQNLQEFTTGHMVKETEKRKKYNNNLIFGTDSLKGAKVVLGQVDFKFIAAIIQRVSQKDESPEFLVFFDQHAVHERIRLEENLSYYFDDNHWKKVTIDTISMKSTKDEILYLHNHKDKFTQLGLEWTISNNSEILVNGIPEAIRGKNPRPIDTVIKTVKDLIIEEMHAIKNLKGNVSLFPQSIMNLVFSEACRYAIKFGIKLSLRESAELIAKLANCKTPFQCAHGRPVMAVMVELKNELAEYKVNMETIKQFRNRIKK